jgi:hypothetical protein
MRRFSAGVLSAVMAVAAMSAMDGLARAQDAAAPSIEAAITANMTWRVANPFRLFKDPKNSDLHRAT